jgi:hypothetical protein
MEIVMTGVLFAIGFYIAPVVITIIFGVTTAAGLLVKDMFKRKE